MKKLLILLTAILIGGCSVIKPVPIETGTTVHVIDSTIYHVIDSVRITEATRYKDMAWLGDTLKIEGNRSRMWAYADTTKEAVIGGLEEDKVEEKTRIVYKDRIEYRDSIVTKEVPVPVEVVKTVHPKYEKWLWIWSVLSFLGIALFIYKKVLPK